MAFDEPTNIIDLRPFEDQLTNETRPTAPLCWEENPRTLERCDRRQGHQKRHSWQFVEVLDAIEAEIALHGNI